MADIIRAVLLSEIRGALIQILDLLESESKSYLKESVTMDILIR